MLEWLFGRLTCRPAADEDLYAWIPFEDPVSVYDMDSSGIVAEEGIPRP